MRRKRAEADISVAPKLRSMSLLDTSVLMVTFFMVSSQTRAREKAICMPVSMKMIGH
ncbi:MAG: hypothetical protein ACKVKH_06625 [Verrucomicrobiales bacterium]|jgi:hypothetical protein